MNSNSISLSNFLVSQLERQGLAANQLPRRQSDWDFFLRAVDRAFADVSALQVQANRASALAEEELVSFKESIETKLSELSELSKAGKESDLAQKTLDVAGLGWFLFDPSSSNVSMNDGLAAMLGLDKTSALMPLSVLRHSLLQEDQSGLLAGIAKTSSSGECVEIKFRSQSPVGTGKEYVCRLHPYNDTQSNSKKILGAVLGAASASDWTRRVEQMPVSMSSFDHLTRVCNRQHFFAFCRDKMAAPSSADDPFALLFLDLNAFKKVNESLGQKAGDQLLQLVALRISSLMPDPTCVARYGADQFLVMVKNATDVRHIDSFTNSLLAHVASPFSLETTDVTISASIGVTFFPAHGNTIDRLLQSADTALLEAKSKGRNTWKAFDLAANAELSARFSMVNRLRDAIATNKLDLAFQPLVEGQSKKIYAVEALARWYDAELGPVSPAIFIPLAESCGLIEAIGQFVLRQSLKTLKSWDVAGAQRVILSVNFSAIQFSNPNFVQMIQDMLTEFDLPASRLQVEITESMMLDDVEACNVKLQALRKLGARIAIDDFGTGYSSLAYLESLPIDCIKIDKSFVGKISDLNQRLPMIEAVIAIANSLRMDVLAEGVETEVQRLRLLNLGCNSMQGYYFHRPSGAQKTVQLLTSELPVMRPQAFIS